MHGDEYRMYAGKPWFFEDAVVTTEEVIDLLTMSDEMLARALLIRSRRVVRYHEAPEMLVTIVQDREALTGAAQEWILRHDPGVFRHRPVEGGEASLARNLYNAAKERLVPKGWASGNAPSDATLALALAVSCRDWLCLHPAAEKAVWTDPSSPV